MPSNRSLTTHKTARPISLCQGAIAIGLHKACLLNSEQRFSNNFNVVWWTAAKQVSQFCYISMFMIVLQFQSWNHRKSLWFPVTCISKVWGQQTYAACTLDKQTIANNLSCSLYRLKYTAPKNYVFQSLSQIHPNHITCSAVNLADTFESTGEIPVDQVAIKALGRRHQPKLHALL